MTTDPLWARARPTETDARGALVAAILVGGASTRYGRDKARETLGGVRWWQRVADAAAPVADRVVVVGVRDDVSFVHPDVVSVPDICPGEGPLQALLSVWMRYPECDVLLLPCDVPLIHASALRVLAQTLAPDRLARVLRLGGRTTPIPGFYRAAAAPHAAKAWAGGRRSLHALVTALPVQYLEAEQMRVDGVDPRAFQDADTPAAFDELLASRVVAP